jgi:isopentenyl-diphosphate delta-isomerase
MDPAEQVDLVTNEDKVIGNISKEEAHQKGLLHRTVIAEVIASDGSWTLVKQSADRQDPGQFVSPIGGHVRSGETEEEALKREAEEEYGLTGDYEFHLVGKKIFNRQVNGHEENHYFILFEIYDDRDPVLNEESVDSASFTREELDRQVKENPEKFGAAFHFVFNSFYSAPVEKVPHPDLEP